MQIGISGDALRTLQGVAKRYNVTQEALGAGLTKFNVSFGRLKQNQGAFYNYLRKTNPALAAQFKQVGSTGDAFLLLSDAISKTADPAKRAALIKAAGLPQEFLRFFADGPDDLRETIKEVIKFQGLLGPGTYREAARYGDAVDNIGLAWIGLRDRMAAAALPVVNPMLEELANFVAENRENIVAGFKEIAISVGGSLRSLGSWLNSDKGRKFFSELWPELQKVSQAFQDIASSVLELVGAVKSVGGWPAVLGALVALKMGGGGGGMKGFILGLGALLWDAPHPEWMDQTPAEALKKLFGDNAARSPVTGRRSMGIIDSPPDDRSTRARPSDIPTEAELRRQLAFEQSRADRLDADIRRWQQGGEDKADPEGFAAMTRQRFLALRSVAAIQTVLARTMRRNADEIGKKIGASAADSFVQRLGLAFARFGVGAGQVGGGAGRIWQASYGGGGGGAGFAGLPGAVPANMAAGADRAMALLRQSGFSSVQAAAIAGNLQQESSFNPNSFNRKEGAHGLMQWRGSRWANLRRWAAGRGLNPNSFTAQIGFLRQELTNPIYGEAGKAAARALLRARTIGEANAALKGFIRYGDDSANTRLRNGSQILRRHQEQSRGKVEGSASVDIRFPNGVPAGTRVGASGKGIFRQVNLDTGRAMKPALA